MVTKGVGWIAEGLTGQPTSAGPLRPWTLLPQLAFKIKCPQNPIHSPLPSSFPFQILNSNWCHFLLQGSHLPSHHCLDMLSHYRPVLLPRDYLSSLWLPGMVSPTTDLALLLQTL